MTDLQERTKEFALAIIRLHRILPRNLEAKIIGQQVLRSGTSVGAHYREAIRARSSAEYISKLEVALQELEESAYWLELLRDAHLVESEKLFSLFKEIHELIAILVACVKKAKSNKTA
jgi:four helix bundle protein